MDLDHKATNLYTSTVLTFIKNMKFLNIFLIYFFMGNFIHLNAS